MTTLNPELNKKDVLINSVMGLCGESGEAIDIVKKWLAQGHKLDKDHLAKEFGDIAWYLAETATALDLSLEEILQANIDKRKKRYPDGFDTERSIFDCSAICNNRQVWESERHYMNTTNKFDSRAIDYTASRPNYSTDFINCLYSQYGISKTSVIADIGSGTGKFSKHLLDRQSEVYCVEPNDDMRGVAEKELCEYENFHSVAGSAENTMLKSNFVDCITTAQAFHWFDVLKFKQECLRIIKNDGRVFLIWNIRDYSDIINQEWHNVFLQYCPNFKGFSNGIERDDPKIKTFFDKGYKYITFDHPLIFDRENFIKRSLSSSYSLKEDDVNYGQYISALNELFDKYENNGVISISNQSVAYIGIIK